MFAYKFCFNDAESLKSQIEKLLLQFSKVDILDGQALQVQTDFLLFSFQIRGSNHDPDMSFICKANI